jgi:hypothetical protein
LEPDARAIFAEELKGIMMQIELHPRLWQQHQAQTYYCKPL